MFERLHVLYTTGRLSANGINVAASRGWITQDEADEITHG